MTSSETIIGSFIYTTEYDMVNDTNNGIGGSTFLIASIGCLIKTSMSFIKTKKVQNIKLTPFSHIYSKHGVILCKHN